MLAGTRTLSAPAPSQAGRGARRPGAGRDRRRPTREASARCPKHYAGTSPITQASGRPRVVLARSARNRRLADALHQQAFCALTASAGARGDDDALPARGIGHHAARRQLATRLVGILHGCLASGTRYHEATARAHHTIHQRHAAA
jgi:hypothetical protein